MPSSRKSCRYRLAIRLHLRSRRVAMSREISCDAASQSAESLGHFQTDVAASEDDQVARDAAARSSASIWVSGLASRKPGMSGMAARLPRFTKTRSAVSVRSPPSRNAT